MSYSAFPIKKSRHNREMSLIEAYRTIEITRDNLMKFSQTMALLTDMERKSIVREAARLTIWLSKKYKEMKEMQEAA